MFVLKSILNHRRDQFESRELHRRVTFLFLQLIMFSSFFKNDLDVGEARKGH